MNKILTTFLPIIFSFLFILSAQSLLSQSPPDPPSGHGSSSNQNSGAAPIGGGLFILLGLAAAYGGKKLYEANKEKLEE